MKYAHIVEALPENELFTPAKIAHFAQSYGFLEDETAESLPRARIRVRVYFSRFANDNEFPKEGDGLVFLPGQPGTPGWYGSRWKNAVRTKRQRKIPTVLSDVE